MNISNLRRRNFIIKRSKPGQPTRYQPQKNTKQRHTNKLHVVEQLY